MQARNGLTNSSPLAACSPGSWLLWPLAASAGNPSRLGSAGGLCCTVPQRIRHHSNSSRLACSGAWPLFQAAVRRLAGSNLSDDLHAPFGGLLGTRGRKHANLLGSSSPSSTLPAPQDAPMVTKEVAGMHHPVRKDLLKRSLLSGTQPQRLVGCWRFDSCAGQSVAICRRPASRWDGNLAWLGFVQRETQSQRILVQFRLQVLLGRAGWQPVVGRCPLLVFLRTPALPNPTPPMPRCSADSTLPAPEKGPVLTTDHCDGVTLALEQRPG